MNVLCMISLVATMMAPVEKKTFANYEFGLQFDYPTTWQLSKKKDYSKFLIPLEGGGTAELYLHSAIFHQDIETWMAVQKNIVLQMKRELVSQTQEEIMGVPLLITRSRYTVKESSMVCVSGLIYSATPRKLLYRLIATDATIDTAVFTWQQAMQSMRTTTGKGPKSEDPNRKIDPKDNKVDNHPPDITTIDGKNKIKNGNQQSKKGPVTVQAEAGGKNVLLRLPEGWGGEKQKDGSITIKHPDLASTITVTINSLLDSEPANKALFRLSSKSLDAFVTVSKRDEPKVAPNLAGAMVNAVWRTGKSTKGDLMSCEASGTSGDYYWLFSFMDDAPTAAADRKLIESLIKTMSVEPSE